MAKLCSLSVAFLASYLTIYLQNVQCDVYLHNPRGSNNRLNGRGANRNNANRVFDSQNNAKGGYTVGEIYPHANGHQDLQYNMKYFMSGSKHNSLPGKIGKSFLTIEWTNQHGCGDQDLNCDIILQYKCQDNRYGSIYTLNSDTMRNGQTTNTPRYTLIKDSVMKTVKDKQLQKSRQVHPVFVLHEPWEWYDKCNRRERNQGLFTADQNLKGTTSKYTRQNPNGNQYGYECPEERDYYPYWHPTDWKDIAVMANDEKRCDYYRKNSFNTNKKGECLEYYLKQNKKTGFKHASKYNNPKDCSNGGGIWVMFTNSLEEMPKFTTKKSCEAASTKEIPLVWGIPYVSEDIDALEMDPDTLKPKESCLVKLPEPDCQKASHSRTNHLGNGVNAVPLNYTWVLPYFQSGLEQRCVLRIRYNISTMDYDRDNTFRDQNGDKSPVKNDPKVKATKFNIPLQLAVNTAQFGRTFQDRSYVFTLRPRRLGNIPDDGVVHNLNVRGKRGNIVQVYPAVEYDFVPRRLVMNDTDYVHIQWTGANTNPHNNDGEGRRGTDRSNMVQTDEPGRNVKLSENGKMFESAEVIWNADYVTETNNDLAVSMASSGFFNRVIRSSPVQNQRFLLNLKFQDQLDNSSPSFPGVVLKLKKGIYYYMCTRNNNFTNRNQKGQITVL